MKRWKLSYEDFRNRARWADYVTAIEDMMEKTSTKHAPWHLVPANNKPFGRVAAFRILKERLGEGVSLEPRPIDPGLSKRPSMRSDSVRSRSRRRSSRLPADNAPSVAATANERVRGVRPIRATNKIAVVADRLRR